MPRGRLEACESQSGQKSTQPAARRPGGRATPARRRESWAVLGRPTGRRRRILNSPRVFSPPGVTVAGAVPMFLLPVTLTAWFKSARVNW